MAALDVSRDKTWDGYACQYIDREVVVFSKKSVLYEVDLSNDEVISSWSFPKSNIYKLVPSSITSRALREQFYNVIKIKKGYFVVWCKSIYYVEGDNVRFIKKIDFRIFRGGCVVYNEKIYFGEYSDNSIRQAVKIYSFDIETKSLNVELILDAGSVRHIHAIKYFSDEELAILTGDLPEECKIILFNIHTKNITEILSGDEDYRAIYGFRDENKFIYATDAQYKTNSIFEYDINRKRVIKLLELDGPVFYGAKISSGSFFSVVYEGDIAQIGRSASLLYRCQKKETIKKIYSSEKDFLSTKYFQFGQVILPYVGDDDIDTLWFSTIALKSDGKAYKVKVN
ncbi:hypothetical protein [Vibrio sp. 1S139]|uniref:hypothetical protein n=1 Tax=Vibrio sp. 1S139 TaxID=3230006 RepID=UPI00352CA3A2